MANISCVLFHVSRSHAAEIYESRAADCCAVVYFAPSHQDVIQEQRLCNFEDTLAKTLAKADKLIIETSEDIMVEITALVFHTHTAELQTKHEGIKKHFSSLK